MSNLKQMYEGGIDTSKMKKSYGAPPLQRQQPSRVLCCTDNLMVSVMGRLGGGGGVRRAPPQKQEGYEIDERYRHTCGINLTGERREIIQSVDDA